MYYLYLLISRKYKRLYIGITENITRRLLEHNNASNRSTKYGIPWELVYLEGYRSRLDVTNREKKLKSYGSSLSQLKKRIRHSLLLEPRKAGEGETGDEA